VLLLFIFVIKPMLRSLSAESGTQRTPLQLPQTVAGIEKTLEAGQPMGRNVIDWAQKNPKDASNLIKNWIEEK
jgi:hypothetical protein